jgi:hypothetical protein
MGEGSHFRYSLMVQCQFPEQRFPKRLFPERHFIEQCFPE